MKQWIAQAVCSQNLLLPLFFTLSSIISRERKAPAAPIPHFSHSYIPQSTPLLQPLQVTAWRPWWCDFFIDNCLSCVQHRAIRHVVCDEKAPGAYSSQVMGIAGKINMRLFITAGSEESGLWFQLLSPNNVCCHTAILAISATDEHSVSSEIFAKHDKTLKATPQHERVYVCTCVWCMCVPICDIHECVCVMHVLTVLCLLHIRCVQGIYVYGYVWMCVWCVQIQYTCVSIYAMSGVCLFYVPSLCVYMMAVWYMYMQMCIWHGICSICVCIYEHMCGMCKGMWFVWYMWYAYICLYVVYMCLCI